MNEFTITEGPLSDARPVESDVRAELASILSSALLQKSERRRNFLKFIVEETLDGRSSRLKGFTIATEVFNRDASFDGKLDPAVRLEARRLRRDLDSYYFGEGRHDPVRISIPKGTYVPCFEWHERPAPVVTKPVEKAEPEEQEAAEAKADRPKFLERIGYTVLAVALVAVFVAGWFLGPRRGTPDHVKLPAVVVVPFEAIGGTDTEQYLAAAMSPTLVDILRRFPGMQLYGSILSTPSPDQSPIALGQDLGAAYVLTGTVQSEGEDVRISAQLLEAATGRLIWARTFDRDLDPADLITAQNDLAADIATEIGQPYGAINSNLNLNANSSDVSDMESYLCLLRAHAFWRDFEVAKFAPVVSCLQTAVRKNPDFSDAWAMLGRMHLAAGIFRLGPNDRNESLALAIEAGSHALTLDPNSTLALLAISGAYHYSGIYAEAERYARMAVEQNPYDPLVLVNLGWRLAVRGNFEEGIPLVKSGIARSAHPPGWYFHTLAIERLMEGDGPGMLEFANRASSDGSAISQSLIAMAFIIMDDHEAAQQAIARMNEISPDYDPIRAFLNHQATDEIIGEMTQALARIGWTRPAKVQ
ncbi:hypothetical protein [Pseudoruegeria sp. HB172150]|uniref:hypothetical protein n=1 Tax=Pseudoruegeria sp. HB172150 TaxID=2721164 RepID=UPI0015526B49|nr:hypothetical protein [Pseudoruegeria sp. HB172150]